MSSLSRKKSPPRTRLRLGTRGSPLARAQSEWVAERLRALQPGLRVELVVIRTSGDRLSAAVNSGASPSARRRTARSEDGSSVSGSAPPEAPNVKAMFVKELEAALLRGTVDLAVHSAKDLPAELAPGLRVAAYPERELPFDVFLGREKGRSWASLPRRAVIGTSSLRRRFQLARLRPDFRFAPLRGNVHTRLRKLRAGEADGTLLAAAGLRRLGLDSLGAEVLHPGIMVPAPGQGALAIEAVIPSGGRSAAHDGNGGLLALLARLDHGPTRLAVETERAFLRKAGGGCATPLGALAVLEEDRLHLRVFGSDLRGRRPVSLSGRCGSSAEERGFMVDDLAERLLKAIR